MAAGIHMTVRDGIINNVRIAFGGMAATPKRASKAEAALNGQPWAREGFEAAAEALAEDFSPLTDWRASSDYRMLAAQNLLRRFFLEKDSQTDTPVQLACA